MKISIFFIIVSTFLTILYYLLNLYLNRSIEPFQSDFKKTTFEIIFFL